MTVIDPTTPVCPQCGSEELNAEVRINHTIKADGNGGIEWINNHPDSFGSFERLECAMCDHVFIEEGEIVDDRVSGRVV